MARKTKNLDQTATLETGESTILESEIIESEPQTAVEKIEPQTKDNSEIVSGLVFQAWLGVAIWMSFGLLMEGFIGYRIPGYFADSTRRELFRLAHAHGALLSIMLLGVAFCANRFPNTPNFAIWAMRAGTILMPIGFLLGGVWHFPGEPGIAVWLVPVAALLIIFAAIALALAAYKK